MERKGQAESEGRKKERWREKIGVIRGGQGREKRQGTARDLRRRLKQERTLNSSGQSVFKSTEVTQSEKWFWNRTAEHSAVIEI